MNIPVEIKCLPSPDPAGLRDYVGNDTLPAELRAVAFEALVRALPDVTFDLAREGQRTFPETETPAGFYRAAYAAYHIFFANHNKAALMRKGLAALHELHDQPGYDWAAEEFIINDSGYTHCFVPEATRAETAREYGKQLLLRGDIDRLTFLRGSRSHKLFRLPAAVQKALDEVWASRPTDVQPSERPFDAAAEKALNYGSPSLHIIRYALIRGKNPNVRDLAVKALCQLIDTVPCLSYEFPSLCSDSRIDRKSRRRLTSFLEEHHPEQIIEGVYSGFLFSFPQAFADRMGRAAVKKLVQERNVERLGWLAGVESLPLSVRIMAADAAKSLCIEQGDREKLKELREKFPQGRTIFHRAGDRIGWLIDWKTLAFRY